MKANIVYKQCVFIYIAWNWEYDIIQLVLARFDRRSIYIYTCTWVWFRSHISLSNIVFTPFSVIYLFKMWMITKNWSKIVNRLNWLVLLSYSRTVEKCEYMNWLLKVKNCVRTRLSEKYATIKMKSKV